MYFFPIIKIWTFHHIIIFRLGREITFMISTLGFSVWDPLCSLRDAMSFTSLWAYTRCPWHTRRPWLIYKYHLWEWANAKGTNIWICPIKWSFGGRRAGAGLIPRVWWFGGKGQGLFPGLWEAPALRSKERRDRWAVYSTRNPCILASTPFCSTLKAVLYFLSVGTGSSTGHWLHWTIPHSNQAA